MATRIATRYFRRNFSSGRKVLGKEEQAAENVYIKKDEQEKLEQTTCKALELQSKMKEVMKNQNNTNMEVRTRLAKLEKTTDDLKRSLAIAREEVLDKAADMDRKSMIGLLIGMTLGKILF